MTDELYYFDKCKNCEKLKQPYEMYFCTGCGFGKMEDEQFAWEEILLSEDKRHNFKDMFNANNGDI